MHKTRLQFSLIYYLLEFFGYRSLRSRSAFSSTNNCEGQLQTPQSGTILILLSNNEFHSQLMFVMQFTIGSCVPVNRGKAHQGNGEPFWLAWLYLL